jgi:quinolinate synthase
MSEICRIADQKVIAWKGHCEVRGAGEASACVKRPFCPDHRASGCRPTCATADYTGSTSGMIDWVRQRMPKRVVMITECSMADNVHAELPEVSSCGRTHMSGSHASVYNCLLSMKEEVTIIHDRRKHAAGRPWCISS